MSVTKLFAAIVLFACTFTAQATNHILTPFFGEWVSDGPAFRQPAKSTMIWGHALNEKFVRLNYRIEMGNPAGQKSLFEGIAHYKTGEGNTLSAYWADNSGDLHPIAAKFDGHTLVSIWGKEGGKMGRTRYELITPDEMQVTDWIKTPNGWRQFNDNKFTKLP